MQSLLRQALLGQRDYAAAEPLLVEGYRGLQQREDRIPPILEARLREARERLARLYEATGQHERADEWRKRPDRAKPVAQPPAKP